MLQSFPEPRPTTNPYLVMLARALRAEPAVTVLNFSWRTALTGRYDVFHVHWPEIMVTGGQAHKRLARQVMFVVLLGRLALTGIPIVRTRHNLELPEGLTPVQRLLLACFERRTTLVIRLNALTPETGLAATIVHGHYRDWFAPYPRPEAVPGRFAYAGLIRRYKGVEGLLGAFAALHGPDLSLTVGGKPSGPELAQALTLASRDDPRISLDLRFLPDEDFVHAVSESELVVFPYTFMHNSGGVLAALSLDRSVLVPDNEVNRRLAREVGPDWFSFFDGTLGAADLRNALEQASHRGRRPGRAARPDLDNRSWDHAAADHLAAYRRAMGAGRGRNKLHGRNKLRGGDTGTGGAP
ncbi:MAG: glycosyltransferase [Specibacter sp.]